MSDIQKQVDELGERLAKNHERISSGAVSVSLQNEEKLKAIWEWQRSDDVHPLTCGKCSDHKLLIPIYNCMGSDTIAIVCPDYGCDYIQEKIPEIVYQKYINAHFAG